MAEQGAALLTAEAQQALTEQKIQLQAANERYLREHPEVNTMIEAFMTSLLDKKPDDVVGFAVQFFTVDGK